MNEDLAVDIKKPKKPSWKSVKRLKTERIVRENGKSKKGVNESKKRSRSRRAVPKFSIKNMKIGELKNVLPSKSKFPAKPSKIVVKDLEVSKCVDKHCRQSAICLEAQGGVNSSEHKRGGDCDKVEMKTVIKSTDILIEEGSVEEKSNGEVKMTNSRSGEINEKRSDEVDESMSLESVTAQCESSDNQDSNRSNINTVLTDRMIDAGSKESVAAAQESVDAKEESNDRAVEGDELTASLTVGSVTKNIPINLDSILMKYKRNKSENYSDWSKTVVPCEICSISITKKHMERHKKYALYSGWLYFLFHYMLYDPDTFEL